MCGIAGFYKHNQNILHPFLVDEANEIQVHRGPDFQSGTYLHDEKVGLFHQRLSILDLTPDGNQPMTTQCDCCGDGIYITYNGEIYNYQALKTSLAQKGHVFYSKSDTEVIIHLYAEYGLKAFSMLNGIFSIALFDGREFQKDDVLKKNDLIIVRDQLGVKPLYYSENNRYLSFASELKTLLLDRQLSRELDYTAVNNYLTYLWSPAPNTMLKNAKKVKPGHYMIVRSGQIRLQKQYYEIPIRPRDQKVKLNEAELVEQTKFYLKQAVSRQLIADVPIGAFLSGGLDSSAIVALMREQNPKQNIDCYTIGFKNTQNHDGFVEDLPYAEKVARHLGVNLDTVWVSDDIYKNIPQMIYHLDEPQADPAPVNAMLIAKQAYLQGYKVLMSGAGGDDIFSGYRRHYALRLDEKINRLPMSLRKPIAILFKAIAGGIFGPLHGTKMRRLTKFLLNCDLSGNDKIASYFCWSQQSLRQKLFSPEVLEQIQDINNLQIITHDLNMTSEKYDDLDKMLLLECKHFLSDHNLNYTDKVTMAHSIETRVPLLDLDLVDFCYTLPVHVKQNGNQGKYIFKKAMESYLPHDVIYRPKTGFGVPLRDWIHKGMSPAIMEVLSKENVNKRGIFNYKEIEKLIMRDKKNYIDGSYVIFSMFCIELWCQTFIDNKIPAPVNLW
ncbi:asparagine synthase (glutamine-hydrolyzing) [Thiotrichales bacterium 19S11-10]|nr:asparagine synthase (glutamine-hydrolyzing) [Thiotrichales bacterium 19S11-10]